MSARGIAVRALLLLALPVAALAEGAPRLRSTDAGALRIENLPAVLEDETVAGQLTTGLTVVLAMRVDLGSETGGAEIDIRFELWDEVFAVVVRQNGRPVSRPDPIAPDGLAAWWRGLELVVFPERSGHAVGSEAEVRIDVLPFSRSEEAETQRWLASTVRRSADGGASEISRSTDGGDESLGSLVDILIATSVKRQAIRSFSWSVKVEE